MSLAKPADKAKVTVVPKPRADRAQPRRPAGDPVRAPWIEAGTYQAAAGPRSTVLPGYQTARPEKRRPQALRSLIIIAKSMLIVAVVMPISILTLMTCILSIEWILFEEIRMNFPM